MFCCVAGVQETTTVRMFEWVNAINEVAAESRGQFFLRDRLGGAHTLETADEGACVVGGVTGTAQLLTRSLFHLCALPFACRLDQEPASSLPMIPMMSASTSSFQCVLPA